MFLKRYQEIYGGDNNWKSINSVQKLLIHGMRPVHISSTPFFQSDEDEVKDIVNARILALLGDSVTTDHVSLLEL